MERSDVRVGNFFPVSSYFSVRMLRFHGITCGQILVRVPVDQVREAHSLNPHATRFFAWFNGSWCGEPCIRWVGFSLALLLAGCADLRVVREYSKATQVAAHDAASVSTDIYPACQRHFLYSAFPLSKDSIALPSTQAMDMQCVASESTVKSLQFATRVLSGYATVLQALGNRCKPAYIQIGSEAPQIKAADSDDASGAKLLDAALQLDDFLSKQASRDAKSVELERFFRDVQPYVDALSKSAMAVLTEYSTWLHDDMDKEISAERYFEDQNYSHHELEWFSFEQRVTDERLEIERRRAAADAVNRILDALRSVNDSFAAHGSELDNAELVRHVDELTVRAQDTMGTGAGAY